VEGPAVLTPRHASVGCAALVIVVGHDDVPPVHAVGAPVGHGVAGLELHLGVGQQVTGSPAVDADDRGWCPHGGEGSHLYHLGAESRRTAHT